MGSATKDSTPQTGDSRGAAAKDNTFAVFAVFTSLSLAILSLFWEWGSSTGHQPLSSDPEIWLAVMPLCVVLAAGYLMVWFRTMSSTVFNLCVLVAAGWVAYLLADVVNTMRLWDLVRSLHLGHWLRLALRLPRFAGRRSS